MRHFYLVLITITVSIPLLAGSSPEFNDYFMDSTMRVDIFHTGDAGEDIITIDQVYQQGNWAGNPNRLIDRFNNGKYYLNIYDIASNRLIYSRGFNTYFGEYQTTDPAINGEKKTFHESLLFPFPKNSIRLVLEKRDLANVLAPIFSKTIDPDDIHIIRESADRGDTVFEIVKNGHPHQKVDIAIIAEGYSAAEKDNFETDLQKRVELLFGIEPFKSRRKKFNIYGIFSSSPDSGVDEPRNKIFKRTVLNASFNALDLDRYLLTEDNRALRNIAGQVPYDAIMIMVNSKRYGGGGIYNFYAIFTAGSPYSEKVFVHEFGHSFAGLADEYYASSVAYNDFYPKGLEPTEPNITALLNPERLKWDNEVDPGKAIPSNWNKSVYDSLKSAIGELYRSQRKTIDSLKLNSAPESDIQRIKDETRASRTRISEELKTFMSDHPLKNKTGFFEGAGYASQGLYRPMLNCLMFSNDKDYFCDVCDSAIKEMIDFYCE